MNNIILVGLLSISLSFFTACSEDGSVEITINTSDTNTTNTTTNSAPTITSSATVSVNENQTSVLTVTAADADSDPLTYSLGGANVTSFDINSSTGIVTFIAAPDYETPPTTYNLTANVSDGTDTTTQDVTVNVLNVGEVVPTLANSTANIAENSAVGTYVGDVNITSIGDIAITAITLSGTGNANFSVDASGAITVASGAILDYETNIDYNLTAIATNDAGDSTSVAVTISITDIVETPPTLASSTGSVDENAVDGISVGTVAITSTGGSAISAITLSGTGSGNFSVDTSGAITVATGATLDYETTPSYSLTAVATNTFGDSTSVAVTISITDIVETPPTLASSTGSVDENAVDGISVGTVAITSTGGSAISAITLSGTGSENFSVDTSGAITVATGATLDYETTPSYSLTAVATNIAGDSTSVAVTISIINVAETAPTLAASTGTVAEDAGTGISVGTVTITDAGDTTITAITLSGTGYENFSVDTSGAITVATGATLDYETFQDYNLTAIATNSAGNSMDVNIDISVTDIADTAPTLAASTGSLDENAADGTSVGTVTITDIGDTAITLITLSGTGSGNFSVDTSGAITVATGATLDYETTPSYSLTAVATNTAGDSTSVAITISITDIADAVAVLAPSTGSVSENASATTYVGTVTITDIGDTAISAITLSGTGSGNFSVDTSGVITTASIIDYETTPSYSLTAVATNIAGDSTSVAVTISIINVAETAPTLAASTGTVAEDAVDGISVGSVTITDSGDTAISEITLSGTGSSNFSVDTSGAITVATGATLDYETAQDYNLTAIATNSAGNSTSVNVDISVTDVADVVPTITAFSASIDENVATSTVVGSIVVGDAGDSIISSYTLSDTSNFNISSAGEITTASALDYETTTSYSLTVYATNTAGNSSSVAVTININDLADVVPTLSDFTASIDENVTISTVVGSIVVSDVGDSSITSYTLSDTTNFNISAAGEISTVTTFDYNTTSVYNLTVVAASTAGDSNTANVIINIISVAVPATSAICEATNLTFDFLPTTVFTMWPEGQEGVQDSTKLYWNDIDNAYEYLLDITTTNYSAVGWNFWDVTNMSFIYDGATALGAISDGTSFIVSSIDFIVGANVTLTLRAINSSAVTIATSEPITFTIGKDYITQIPEHITSTSSDTAVGLEWCALDAAPSSYTIKYGTSESNLATSITGISSATLSQTIGSLTNGSTGYYFAVAGANANGDGRFSEVINTIPGGETSIDLSIENVTFNQAVQVDLDNNTNATPIIANKPGVLRVFVNNSLGLAQNLKVDVKLAGTDINGTTLTPVIKEVSLNDSTLANADSTNKVIFFDVNTTEWMGVGTTFYVELDPDNKIIETSDANNRYPASGEELFGFEDRYKMRVKLIPITTSNGAVTITQEIIDGTKAYLEAIYPLDEVEVTLGGVLSSLYPVDSAGNYWSNVLSDLQALKDTEVSGDSTLADVFYYGFIESSGIDASGVAGLAYLNELAFTTQAPWLSAIGRIDEIGLQKIYEVAAHEIGHNHGRSHVSSAGETNDNCGTPTGTDGSYPYAIGRIGKTGFSSVAYNLLEKEQYHDIMTYCDRYWISDYNYKAIYDFEVNLDTFYSRSTNPNAYLAPPLIHRTLGNMIYGDLTQDAIYTLKRQSELLWDSEISQADTRLYAIVKFTNLTEMRIPLFLVSLDHSDSKMFKFFIPSLEEIDSIVIEDTELLTFTTMQ